LRPIRERMMVFDRRLRRSAHLEPRRATGGRTFGLIVGGGNPAPGHKRHEPQPHRLVATVAAPVRRWLLRHVRRQAKVAGSPLLVQRGGRRGDTTMRHPVGIAGVPGVSFGQRGRDHGRCTQGQSEQNCHDVSHVTASFSVTCAFCSSAIVADRRRSALGRRDLCPRDDRARVAYGPTSIGTAAALLDGPGDEDALPTKCDVARLGASNLGSKTAVQRHSLPRAA
jgi:hypothetical protein